jgi:hypothetical protein
VLDESIDLAIERLGSKVCPLLTKITLFCQPLDVKVMGPLKAKIQNIWLADTTETRTAAEKQTCLVELRIKAFKEISEDTIKRAWYKFIFLMEEDNMVFDTSINYSKKDSENNKNNHSKVLMF